LLWTTVLGAAVGFYFPLALIAVGLTGMGSIFMFMQENNHRAQ
jgi:Lon-like ATP-dependent protease